MGRAHANAWGGVNRFFTLPRIASLDTVASRDLSEARAFAKRWDFDNATDDWRSMLDDEAISVVDVVTPNHMHAEMSIEALNDPLSVKGETGFGYIQPPQRGA